MSLVNVVAIIGAALGLLLALALLMIEGRNQYANRILALFVSISSLYLLLTMPLHNNWNVSLQWPALGFMSLFLCGPLLWAYVKSMVQESFRLTFKHAAHLLPLLLLELVIRWVAEPGVNYFKLAGQATGPSNLFAWFPIIFYVQLQLYIVAALYILKPYEQKIQQQLSYQEGVNLSWLRILLRVCLVIAFVGMSISIFRLISDVELWPRAIYSMSLMFSVYYLIAFKAMAQPSIFNKLNTEVIYPGALEVKMSNDGIDTSIVDAGIESISQYQTSSLTPELAQQYWQSLQEHITQHKPYLNNELRIKDIADSLSIPSNHLSQVINQCAGQNFFEFINSYRIEVAKSLLSKTDSPQLNINLIALEAGFNSQSAFYKQFKLRVNKTPKQYRDQFAS